MVSGGNAEGAQYIVHASHFHRFAVDGGRPTRIVDFGEHRHTVFAVVARVAQFIRRIVLELDAALSVGGAFEQRFEPGIGHGLVFRVEFSEGTDFGIGVVGKLHLVDKPRIAVGVRVAESNVTAAEDHPLHVEHI